MATKKAAGKKAVQKQAAAPKAKKQRSATPSEQCPNYGRLTVKDGEIGIELSQQGADALKSKSSEFVPLTKFVEEVRASRNATTPSLTITFSLLQQERQQLPGRDLLELLARFGDFLMRYGKADPQSNCCEDN